MNIAEKFNFYDPNLPAKKESEKQHKENSPCLTYGSVNYLGYEDKYIPRGYGQRKIIAIPTALCAGIVKSIYHLAKAIFYGITKACKECYNYFEKVLKKPTIIHINNNYPLAFSQSFINGMEIPHVAKAQKITLRNFREMNSEAQQETIKKFQLQSNIDAIGKESFFNKLGEASEQVLELVNLVDLKMDVKSSKLKYAFLSNKEFEKVTLGQLKDASADQIQFIFDRLKLIEKETYEDFDQLESVLELKITHFYSLKSEKINEFISEIPASIFFFLSDTQISGLNFSQVSFEQLQNLFCNRNSLEEDLRRFACLPTDQVNAILAKLNNYQMYLLSDEHLKHLDVSKLTENHLQLLFSNRNSPRDDLRRFACLPTDQVNAILAKLNNYQMYLLSDEHLKHLDVSKLTENHLQLLFSNRNGPRDDLRRFACLPTDQVNAILAKLNNYQMYLLSDEHLKHLDVSKLTENHLQLLFSNRNGPRDDLRRFACLPTDQVNAILAKLNNYQMYLLSDEHLKHLDVSKLTENHLQLLFSNRNGPRDDLRRFAFLPADQVNAILAKLNNYQMYLLSDKHLEHLDVSKLTENHLQLLFSNRNGQKEDLRRFACLPTDQVNTILAKLNNYQMYLLSDQHLEHLDISKLTENHLQLLRKVSN